MDPHDAVVAGHGDGRRRRHRERQRRGTDEDCGAQGKQASPGQG
ncbi:hypothetical protein KCH_60260 [Kitasatospora cheerisanensis KCTC 2395]|uniref:Uncharacterized protein n=1 Tax=Kitasatospora cheerisanensis KCTC 2395 TaxID=1348663 RepID=A0A066YM45_9ACTN|nr:hypothetical protein KCH_60260 [Kitasatospora cheerisanensis KCTC 2395]